MKFIKLLFVAYLLWTPSILLAEPGTSCEIPYSRSIRIGWYEPTTPALPVVLMEATQVGTAVSTTAGVLASLDVTLLSQGTRAYTTLEIVSCNDAALPDSGPLPWMDSPTQLSIGDSGLQHQVGAVVGNWILLTGVVSAWSLAATQLGTVKTRFPGGFILPVLFLMGSTSNSAVTLLREGTIGQQFLGGCSLTAQSIGLSTLTVFLHPALFNARWSSENDKFKWLDNQEPGYVKHYGLLFIDYRGGRQWFVAAELLMSTATGVLKSYQATQNHCRDILTAAAAISTTYLVSVAVLRPQMELKDRIFITSIAGLQTLALTTEAISLWTASEETQGKVRTVTESIVMATEWALTIKTFYDIGKRIHSFFQRFRTGSVNALPPSIPSIPTTPTIEMKEFPTPVLDVPLNIAEIDFNEPNDLAAIIFDENDFLESASRSSSSASIASSHESSHEPSAISEIPLNSIFKNLKILQNLNPVDEMLSEPLL